MYKNHIKLIWRNISKNKVFSLLNIVGLATGLLCSLLIYLWIASELAIDNFHENNDRLYSVYQRQIFEGRIDAGYFTPAVLYRELKLKIPEVEKASPMSSSIRNFNHEDRVFREDGSFVGEDYFTMFSFDFLEGNAFSAMNSPDNIAISKAMAQRFFGSVKNAIGKTLSYENVRNLRVSAVFENADYTNTNKSDFYLHWDIFIKENSWAPNIINSGPRTYVLLTENANIDEVNVKIKDFLTEYRRNVKYNVRVELGLQPYGDTYLHSNFENGVISGGRIENVRIFGFIAFFILLIACINFMNLTSASSLRRAKEVGVRKVLAAKKKGLIYQFLGEALSMSLISTVFALVLIAIVLPVFNQLADKNLNLLSLSPLSWLGVSGVALFTGLLSGSYPAFMLSSFRPIDIFRKKTNSNFSAKWIRQGLVVFQFSLSIILISGMIITSGQINYIQNQNLGFNRHNVLLFELDRNSTNDFSVLKEEALQLPGVESMTLTSNFPVGFSNGTMDVVWQGKSVDDPTSFTYMSVGEDFVKTWGTEMILGRDFSGSNTTDNSSYIVNETALKAMGIKNPIGKRLSKWGSEGAIIGVMKDFPINSIKSAIPPLIIENGESESRGTVLARISPTNVVQTVEDLKALYTELYPAVPFEYDFSDVQYDRLYKSETIFFKLLQYFAILAIFISCLGLFGLVMFTAQQKIKEIGIRKVLGASVTRITNLLVKDFLKLVFFGIVIGSPIAWYFMNKWLTNYEYKINMPWWAFGVARVLVVGIALFTVSFESVRAAMVNPVKSLQQE